MANTVSFEGREYRLADRTWEPANDDAKADPKFLAFLNDYVKDTPGPGPQDGFTTLGRHLAIQVARELRADIIELDEVEIPPDAAGRVY
jgi:hypothetical protein